ncbi:MAG TPA: hypothetical protein VJZ06_04340 [Mobilitalea sp.]|nr:hypothetical protein [Mobilitalea sp.]
MSYRVQIDVYGDKDKNKEQTENEEKKNDKWFKRIVLLFLAICFLIYTKEMFTKILIDGHRGVKISNSGDSMLYSFDMGTADPDTLLVEGEKNQDKNAKLTYTYSSGKIFHYIASFSNATDWKNSLISIQDQDGRVLYAKQNGKEADSDASEVYGDSKDIALSYDTLISLTLREGIQWRGNMVLYTIVCLLMIGELLSYKLWEWVFLKHQIKWAVDRGTIQSQLYKQLLRIGRFVVFILILYLSIISYRV